jgi:tetratricopeptide (TPR) repeat protein
LGAFLSPPQFIQQLSVTSINRFFLTAGIGGMIACITCFIYWPGLHGPFVFDDLSNILLIKTTYLKALNVDSLKQAALAVDSGPLHRPIAILSFALNYYFSGMKPYYFKITNLTIHLATGFLLYHLSYQLLRRHTQHYSHAPDSSLRLSYMALGAPAIWLFHPLHLTSVLYIVQRMTSLASLFTVLALLGYTLGRNQIVNGQRRGFVTIIASLTVFGGLSILTKEIGALVPLYVVLVETYFYRMSAAESIKKEFKGFFLLLIAIPLVTGICIAVIKADTLLAIGAYDTRNFTLYERLLTESRAIWFYIRLILAPAIQLMGTYHDDFTVSTSITEPITTSLALAGFSVLVATIIAGYRRAAMLSFALAWYLIGHSLESTVVPLELVHEHRNYLPQFGIILSATYYLTHPSEKQSRTRYLRYIALASYIVVMAVLTHTRAQEWKDEWTLFNAEARHHPLSVRSHTALAVIFFDNKMYTEAGFHFQQAADLQRSEIETVLRLAQFEYARNKAISESLLNELGYRISNYNATTTSIDLFSDLIRDTNNDPKLLKRVIDLYKELTSKYETRLPDKWNLLIYKTLAVNYEKLNEHDNAIEYYLRAAKLQSIATHYLLAARQYAELGNAVMANKLIVTVADKQLNITEADEEILKQLDALLHRGTQTQ